MLVQQIVSICCKMSFLAMIVYLHVLIFGKGVFGNKMVFVYPKQTLSSGHIHLKTLM